MIKKHIFGGVLTLLFMGVVFVPSAQAQTTTSPSMLEQIQALMAKVEELQKQLATLRGEVKEVLRAGISEGMTGDDIKKVQELLATDPTIYPEGKVTGYYGNLTKEAIKRLQMRHELEVTGVIDEATRALLESYLKERFGEQIPPGLLRAPGIAKKVEIRVKDGCDNAKGAIKALFCQKLKVKYEEEDEGDDSDDDSDGEEQEDEEDDSEFGVSVVVDNGSTTVSFTFKGTDYSVEVDSTETGDVMKAVANELDTTPSRLNRDLKSEIRDELENAIDDAADDEDGEDADDDSDEEEDEGDDSDDDSDEEEDEGDDD